MTGGSSSVEGNFSHTVTPRVARPRALVVRPHDAGSRQADYNTLPDPAVRVGWLRAVLDCRPASLRIPHGDGAGPAPPADKKNRRLAETHLADRRDDGRPFAAGEGPLSSFPLAASVRPLVDRVRPPRRTRVSRKSFASAINRIAGDARQGSLPSGGGVESETVVEREEDVSCRPSSVDVAAPRPHRGKTDLIAAVIDGFGPGARRLAALVGRRI